MQAENGTEWSAASAESGMKCPCIGRDASNPARHLVSNPVQVTLGLLGIGVIAAKKSFLRQQSIGEYFSSNNQTTRIPVSHGEALALA